MNVELSRSSDIAQLPLYNYTEVFTNGEASPLTIVDLQESLTRWKSYEKLLGEPVPDVKDILADEKAAATLAKLHTTHKAIIASGARIDADEGEMPTLLANELQLVALPWNAFRQYAESPRQLIKDIHDVHQQYFDDAVTEQGTQKRVINNEDEHLDLDLDSLRYHQPGTPMETQETVAAYIDRKIEEEGPWGFMLIQRGESSVVMRQFPITDVTPRVTDQQQRFWAGDTKIAGDNLGILEWSALLAQRTPEEVTSKTLPPHNLDSGLYANPLLTKVKNRSHRDPGLPDEPEFRVAAKLPLLRQYNATKSGQVHLTNGEIRYNAAPYINTGRIAIAANTDPHILDEIIEDGAKLDQATRLPYTWAKRKLEGMYGPGTVMSIAKEAGFIEAETPRLIDILEESPAVLQSLRRLHLAQLYYEGARLESMGIECEMPPCFQGGDPMGKYGSLELMPWEALLAAAREATEGGESIEPYADTKGVDTLLRTPAIYAESFSTLPQRQQKREESTLALNRTLHDYLVQKVATEGPWGLALRSLLPVESHDRGMGETLFTL